MPTKADLKKLATHTKPKLRKGDRVMIIAGKDKGQTGFIEALSPKEQKAIVLREGEKNEEYIPLNAAVKHRKPMGQQKGARYQIPVPIHLSNLMLLDPKTNEPTRVGRKAEVVDGKRKIVRVAKKSGEVLKDQPVMKERS